MAEFKVTPWDVEGTVDYEKLIAQFGIKHIDDSSIEKLRKHTKDMHYLIRRKAFYAHMYLENVLSDLDKGKKIYLYTGRAPSGPVHLGHIIPWMLTKWLQDKLNAPLLFQIPDEEKFLFKDISLEETGRWAKDNILDIIALGFDEKKTHIFLDTEYAGHMYKHACMAAKRITLSTAKSVFGFDNSSNVGQLFYTCMQSVPAFLPSIIEGKPTQCLIPCAVDQDVHFRVTRDIAPHLGYPKPSTLLCKFFPPLQGIGGKMSASREETAIYLTDSPKDVEKKIKKYAFSGGKDSVEEHRRLGGNPDIDVSFVWLTFFEEDDRKLEKIREEYKSGKMLSGELKQILIEKINSFLSEHQKKRELAKDNVERFMMRD